MDLVFSNCDITSEVDPDLNTGSDHYTMIVTALPAPERGTPGAGKKSIPMDGWEDFGQLMRPFAWTFPKTKTDPPTEDNLDEAAQALQDLFGNVIRAAGRTRHQNGHSAPWWDKECRTAHKKHCETNQGTTDDEAARKNLKDIVRRRKKEHWDKVIANAGLEGRIWSLASWRKATDRFQPPPLVGRDEQHLRPHRWGRLPGGQATQGNQQAKTSLIHRNRSPPSPRTQKSHGTPPSQTKKSRRP
jgi:hypothetical protein